MCIPEQLSLSRWSLPLSFVLPLFARATRLHALAGSHELVLRASVAAGSAKLVAVRWIAPVPTERASFVIVPVDLAHNRPR
mgnify:CR=1 FL=1